MAGVKLGVADRVDGRTFVAPGGWADRVEFVEWVEVAPGVEVARCVCRDSAVTRDVFFSAAGVCYLPAVVLEYLPSGGRPVDGGLRRLVSFPAGSEMRVRGLRVRVRLLLTGGDGIYVAATPA